MIDRILNGRYRIISKIGSGGMADVYKGVDMELDRTVAVKVLKQEHSDDPQYLRRLTREARAMFTLENKHIVSLYDMGSEEDIHYLVLEFVDGATLREYIDEHGPLKVHDAVKMICDVLDGLSHAHKNDLIHRDVKPQNILITDKGVIKLTDFGIAKFAGNSTKTFDGKEAMGSVYYISPEQAKGELVDKRADIYSAGVMLYEMLTGYPPFNGENAVQVALKHVNEDIKPLHSVDSHIPIAISDVVAKATAKDKELRYSDADEMIRDLNRALKYPHSRFAKLKNVKPERDNSQKGGFLKEHLPLIIIVACVLGVISLFTVMFFISTASNKDDGYTKVPSFLGYTEESAVSYAENRGLVIKVVGYESSDEYTAGEICYQEPAAQTKVEEGTVVSVVISTGLETVRVPDLYGKTVDEAKKALEALGIELDEYIEYQTSDAPVGTVIFQLPQADETITVGEGEKVRIIVSKEPISETTDMPDIVGKNIYEALALLEDAGIVNYRIFVRTSSDPEQETADFTVVEQNPTAGMEIIYNTINVEITLFLSDPGEFKAEFSENVTFSSESNEIIVTVLSDIGEVVIFTGEYENGTYAIPFTAYFWEKGSFTCIIYVNGEVYTSFIRNFE